MTFEEFTTVKFNLGLPLFIMDLVDYITGTQGLFTMITKGINLDKKRQGQSNLERISELGGNSSINNIDDDVQSVAGSDYGFS